MIFIATSEHTHKRSLTSALTAAKLSPDQITLHSTFLLKCNLTYKMRNADLYLLGTSAPTAVRMVARVHCIFLPRKRKNSPAKNILDLSRRHRLHQNLPLFPAPSTQLFQMARSLLKPP